MKIEVKEYTYETMPDYICNLDNIPEIKMTGEEIGVDLHLQLLVPSIFNHPNKKFPGVVFIQGSAWKKQNIYRNVANIGALAKRGYVCAIVEYRHSGIAHFPAQIIDGKNAIRYLVLCRGLPFRILNSASDLVNKETQKTGAAVDNELAVLALKVKNSEIPLQGALICPAAKSQNPKQISPQNGTLMVARLDGPTDEIAFHLVDKAVQAEQQGLWGKAVIDLRGLTNTAYLVGDQWIKTALTAWGSHGYDVVADYQPETIAEDKPLDSVAFYAGWKIGL